MSKVKVFDVFSGAGGFSCGFEMAGCTVVGAVEHDKWAADTFTFNHKNAKMLLGNIILDTEIRYFQVQATQANVCNINEIPIFGKKCHASNPPSPTNPEHESVRDFRISGEYSADFKGESIESERMILPDPYFDPLYGGFRQSNLTT